MDNVPLHIPPSFQTPLSGTKKNSDGPPKFVDIFSLVLATSILSSLFGAIIIIIVLAIRIETRDLAGDAYGVIFVMGAIAGVTFLTTTWTALRVKKLKQMHRKVFKTAAVTVGFFLVWVFLGV